MDADHVEGSKTIGERDLVEILRGAPVAQLERAALGLKKDDLYMLAQSPVPPFAHIHRVLSCLQVVLLSMSLVRRQTKGVLAISPWPLLRLEVLATVDRTCHKIRKRLTRLRHPERHPHRKPLADAQVRFVLQHALLPTVAGAAEPWENILRVYRLVGLIVESVASFALLCAHYSLFAPKYHRLRVADPIVAPKCLLPNQRAAVATKTGDLRTEVLTSSCVTHSWRCGQKRHGRFFLFRASISDLPLSSRDSATGEYSVFALDSRHSALEWQRLVSDSQTVHGLTRRWSRSYAHAWIKCRSAPNAIVKAIADRGRTCSSMEAATAMSLLLQSASLNEMFLPVQNGLYSPTKQPHLVKQMPQATLTAKDLRFSAHIIFVASRDVELRLVSVGRVVICGVDVTLSSVRRRLQTHLIARSSADPSGYDFHFFIGRVIPPEEELWRSALDLLPLGVVCMDEPRPSLLSKTAIRHWHQWLPMTSELHTKLRRELATCVCPQLEPYTVLPSSTVEVSVFCLDQCVASLAFTTRSCPSSAIDTLVSLFVDWTAFVQFQQLQDSTSVFRVSEFTPKRRSPDTTALSERQGAEERLRPEPTPEEAELLSLPHAKFRPDEEFLRPLYASFTFDTRTEGFLVTPCLDDVLMSLQSGSCKSQIRLAIGNDECIIHAVGLVTRQSSRVDSSGPVKRYALAFDRDFSCPLEILATMRDAFVWEVVPIHGTRKIPHTPTPPLWLRDVFRFVAHPTTDFDCRAHAPWPYSEKFFRVQVPHFLIERLVEATFWSRNIDWQHHWHTCDVVDEILRPKYDALCHSHPPSCSVDSVKFSKFLRECGIQPTYLSVGDAAYLFAKNRTKGSHYEMTYEGFVESMKWIACRVSLPREDGDETSRLHDFCLEWLIRAPSVTAIWQSVVNRWRVQEKLRFMEKTAIQYCAATRVQANWRRFVTRRVLVATLSRMRNERRAAVKVQSVYKMRKQRHYYIRFKAYTIQTQLFVRARRYLRRLRVERAELVERMQRRIQKWMHQRLRVLRCWKSLNAAWLARRLRILDKRSRLLWAGVFQLETGRYRISFYRAANESSNSEHELEDANYELEMLEPKTSWFRSVQVSNKTLQALVDEEHRLGHSSKVPQTMHQNRWKLLVLMRRLHLKCFRTVQGVMKTRIANCSQQPDGCAIQIYRDPLETSLGHLIFQGNVRERDCPDVLSSYRPRFVRLLLRSHDFTLIVYSPEFSTKERFGFTASFVYNLFRVANVHGLMFIEYDVVDEMEARKAVFAMLKHRADNLVAIRMLLRYVSQHGTKPPTREIMPAEVERRFREHCEAVERAKVKEQQRLVALVVMVQANARRLLSIRHVQRLALAAYTKSFDPKAHQMVYRYRRIHDVLAYEDKPRSLRELDVGPPVDEWILYEDTEVSGSCFFNPKRGISSLINDVQAAVRLQRWFRKAMWTGGLPAWDLRCLTQALLFHRRVQPPKDETDPHQLENITTYALQRHLLHHDFKAALGLYESALKISPNHVPALVGLAVLLIYSCRYPGKQTWERGLELLHIARTADPNLSTSLQDIEQNFFRWPTFLLPTNAHAFGNLAIFYQCVREELDKAELLYRRAIDCDVSNEWVIENYLRLQHERTSDGIYSAAGPSKIAIWRAQEVGRNEDWIELEDSGASFASAARFSLNTKTGKCRWTTL